MSHARMWDAALCDRAIQSKIAEGLKAQFDLPLTLPERLTAIMMELEAGESERRKGTWRKLESGT